MIFRIGMIKSFDLINWTEPVIISPKNINKNFGDPGNVIRFGDKWIMCFESYPCPPTGNAYDARIYTMESEDLDTWTEPKLLKVKGPNLSEKEMGRVIGPYLFQDKDEKEKWWCFYKQGGIVVSRPRNLSFGGSDLPPTGKLLMSLHMSFSYDLKTWNYYGCTDSEENYCVFVDGDEYVLIDSPGNGIGVKLSKDLINWYDVGLFTLGQRKWPWAQGRLTAGHVLDLRNVPEVGKYFMVFHGCSYRRKIEMQRTRRRISRHRLERRPPALVLAGVTQLHFPGYDLPISGASRRSRTNPAVKRPCDHGHQSRPRVIKSSSTRHSLRLRERFTPIPFCGEWNNEDDRIRPHL